MSSLVIWAASDPKSQANFRKTVLNGVKLEDRKKLIPADVYGELCAWFPDGRASFWGTAPGKSNDKKFPKVAEGDVGIFYGSVEGGEPGKRIPQFYGQATIVMTFESEELARANWGDDAPWSLIHALVDPKQLSGVTLERFNDAGILPMSLPSVRGYRVEGTRAFERYLEEFDGITASGLKDGPSQAEKDEALAGRRHAAAQQKMIQLKANKETATDRHVIAKARVEQEGLRTILLEGKESGTCALCGNWLPKEFLVAAHIKKRAECTDDERLDAKGHIAMLACTFGCDQLFESGYITVDNDGKVVNARLSDDLSGTYIESYLEGLAGRTFGMSLDGRRKHFKWHRDHTFRR